MAANNNNTTYTFSTPKNSTNHNTFVSFEITTTAAKPIQFQSSAPSQPHPPSHTTSRSVNYGNNSPINNNHQKKTKPVRSTISKTMPRKKLPAKQLPARPLPSHNKKLPPNSNNSKSNLDVNKYRRSSRTSKSANSVLNNNGNNSHFKSSSYNAGDLDLNGLDTNPNGNRRTSHTRNLSTGSTHFRSTSNSNSNSNMSFEYTSTPTSQYSSTIPSFTSSLSTPKEGNTSTALGASHSPSVSYMHIPPAPMFASPSVSYLLAPSKTKPKSISFGGKTESNINLLGQPSMSQSHSNDNITNNNNSNNRRGSQSMPSSPKSHPKSRSFTHRNDILQEDTVYDKYDKKHGYVASPKKGYNPMSNRKHFTEELHDEDEPSHDEDTDDDYNEHRRTILRAKTSHDDMNMRHRNRGSNGSNGSHHGRPRTNVKRNHLNQNNIGYTDGSGSQASSANHSSNNSLDGHSLDLEHNPDVIQRSRTSHDDDHVANSNANPMQRYSKRNSRKFAPRNENNLLNQMNQMQQQQMNNNYNPMMSDYHSAPMYNNNATPVYNQYSNNGIPPPPPPANSSGKGINGGKHGVYHHGPSPSNASHGSYQNGNSRINLTERDMMAMSVKHTPSQRNVSGSKYRGHPHKRHSSTLAHISRVPTIKQSKSVNDAKPSEAKEPDEQTQSNQPRDTSHSNSSGSGTEQKQTKEQKKLKENEDWQIMGDLLFSIRHSLICRLKGMDNNDDEDKKKKNKKNNKKHLDVSQYEWQTFFFEEYASSLFSLLRGKWLNCEANSDNYVKKLFGSTDPTLDVEKLDINKSCKYYWRRLSTNSKSGQIFFQTVNGEYMIKSMPKSEAEFFRKSFLAKYYEYMLEQPDSLLMHIMGCYKIQYKKAQMSIASNNEYNSKRKQDVNKGVYCIVMKSILFCEMTPTVRMHKIYDLKGSTHNRTASRYKLQVDKLTLDALNKIDDKSFEQEINDVDNVNDAVKRISTKYSPGFYQPRKQENLTKFKMDRSAEESNGDQFITVYKRSKVLKDLDFMQDNEIINVGQKLKTKYMLQLRADLDFLIKMNVMDYSLLVGIHRLDIGSGSNLHKKASHRRQHSSVKPKRTGKSGNMFTFEFGGMCNEKVMFDANKSQNKYKSNNPHNINNKKNIYFTGIIDFLQKYNTKKKMESYYKRVKVADGKDAISSVDSKTYANRLYDFIEKRII